MPSGLRRFAGVGGLRRGTRVPGGGGAAFTPADLGAELWLRADLDVTDTGGSVDRWANQGTGGSGLDGTQTGATRPTLNATDANFNGQASLSFSGSQYLQATAGNTALDMADADDCDLIIVCRQTALGADYAFGTTTTASGRFNYEGNSNSASRWQFSDGTLTTLSAAQLTQNAVHVVRCERHGAATPGTDEYQTHLDGTAGGVATVDKGAIAPGAGGSSWMYGSALGGGFSGSWQGQIAEIIMRVGAGAHFTAAELASITAYLNDRYGLALSTV